MTLKYDFGDAWFGFGHAASAADRRMALSVEPDRLFYWTTRESLGGVDILAVLDEQVTLGLVD